MQGLTQERLKELLHYDPETGIFIWKVKSNNRYPKNRIADSLNNKGYIVIGINKKSYKAHRLAFLYVYGKWPIDQIDHINGIKNDNRICNLREANNAENHQNVKKARINNKTTGLLGSSFHKASNKYVSQITLNGEVKCLGWFNTGQEAHEKYLEEKRKIHPFGEI